MESNRRSNRGRFRSGGEPETRTHKPQFALAIGGAVPIFERSPNVYGA